jgi:hypothetical protein
MTMHAEKGAARPLLFVVYDRPLVLKIVERLSAKTVFDVMAWATAPKRCALIARRIAKLFDFDRPRKVPGDFRLELERRAQMVALDVRSKRSRRISWRGKCAAGYPPRVCISMCGSFFRRSCTGTNAR